MAVINEMLHLIATNCEGKKFTTHSEKLPFRTLLKWNKYTIASLMKEIFV